MGTVKKRWKQDKRHNCSVAKPKRLSDFLPVRYAAETLLRGSKVTWLVERDHRQASSLGPLFFLTKKKKTQPINSKSNNLQKYLSRSLEALRKDTCPVGLTPPYYPPKYLNSTRKCTWRRSEVFSRLEQITLKLKMLESMGTGMPPAKKNIWITEQQSW